MKIPSLNLNTVKPLVKPQWKNFMPGDTRRVFEDFQIQNNILGPLSLTIRDCHDGFNRLVIEIKNAMGKIFGKEIISLEHNNNAMTGYNILVEPEYRQKGFHFGELLRLASIMEIIENKSPFIYIFSKETAVYFHGKYKFKPAIKAFEERNAALETIIQDKSPHFKDLSIKAQNIENQIKANKNNAEKQRNLTQKTNDIVREYIQRALEEPNPQKNHPFNRGMDMMLDAETIRRNKDYFNNLFIKHGIDYKI